MIVYLIGGTGNQLIQQKVNAIFYTDILCSKFISRALGFSYHDRGGVQRNFDNIVGYVLLPLLIFELIVLKLFKFTFFTRVDLNSLGVFQPKICLLNIGYFQTNLKQEFNPRILSDLQKRFNLKEYPSSCSSTQAVIHVRGGDSLTSSSISVFGELDESYYIYAIQKVQEMYSDLEFLVFSDDYGYAKEKLKVLGRNVDLKFGSKELRHMVAASLDAKVFIGSRSTLSLMVSCARKDLSVLPYPFQNSGLELIGFDCETVTVDRVTGVKI